MFLGPILGDFVDSRTRVNLEETHCCVTLTGIDAQLSSSGSLFPGHKRELLCSAHPYKGWTESLPEWFTEPLRV